MKKSYLLILSALLAFSTAACNKGNSKEESTSSESQWEYSTTEETWDESSNKEQEPEEESFDPIADNRAYALSLEDNSTLEIGDFVSNYEKNYIAERVNYALAHDTVSCRKETYTFDQEMFYSEENFSIEQTDIYNDYLLKAHEKHADLVNRYGAIYADRGYMDSYGFADHAAGQYYIYTENDTEFTYDTNLLFNESNFESKMIDLLLQYFNDATRLDYLVGIGLEIAKTDDGYITIVCSESAGPQNVTINGEEVSYRQYTNSKFSYVINKDYQLTEYCYLYEETSEYDELTQKILETPKVIREERYIYTFEYGERVENPTLKQQMLDNFYNNTIYDFSVTPSYSGADGYSWTKSVISGKPHRRKTEATITFNDYDAENGVTFKLGLLVKYIEGFILTGDLVNLQKELKPEIRPGFEELITYNNATGQYNLKPEACDRSLVISIDFELNKNCELVINEALLGLSF